MSSSILFLCFLPKTPIEPHQEQEILDLVKSHGSIRRYVVIDRSLAFKVLLETEEQKSYHQILLHLKSVDLSFGKLKIYRSYKKRLSTKAWTIDSSSDKQSDNSQMSPVQTSLKSSTNFIDNSYFLSGSDGLINTTSAPLDARPMKPKLVTETSLNPSKLEFSQLESSLFHGDKAPFLPVHPPANPPSRILQIENLKATELTVKSISKLCGCFGNVISISYKLNQPFMLVRFQQDNQSETALKFLNGLRLFGTFLRLSVLTSREVLMLAEKIDGPSYLIYKESSSFHRFRDNLSIKMNPVTNVLHFTNFSKSLEPFVIYSLITQIHEPVKIVRQFHHDSKSCMYLAYFHSKDDSAQVLAIMHNKNIDGKMIKVSFSNRS